MKRQEFWFQLIYKGYQLSVCTDNGFPEIKRDRSLKKFICPCFTYGRKSAKKIARYMMKSNKYFVSVKIKPATGKENNV